MRGLVASSLVAWLALGCASAKVVSPYEGAQVPRPDLILVYDFAYAPGQVKLDRGISSRVEEALKSKPRTAQELEMGRQVAEVVAEQLVAAIRKLDLPAQRSSVATPYADTVAIEGQFLSIDQGNRTERLVVGFGAGRSDVEADVQIYHDTADGQQLLEKIDASGKSSRRPGMAAMMGVGGLAGHLLVSTVVSAGVGGASEALGASVEDDAKRMAERIAKQLEPFFRQQGWVQ